MARTKAFDRATVLERAMRLFWSRGYAATTTDDLLAAMGISRQSLYDTFGDKRALYLEALGLYHAGRAPMPVKARTATESIRQSLLRVVERPASERNMGCMGINATVSFCGTEPMAATLAGGTAERTEREFRSMIDAGIEAGEFDAETDSAAAARFLYVTLQGLTIRAQAGAAQKTLRSAVDFALKAFAA